jgi:hypothetical protein
MSEGYNSELLPVCLCANAATGGEPSPPPPPDGMAEWPLKYPRQSGRERVLEGEIAVMWQFKKLAL